MRGHAVTGIAVLLATALAGCAAPSPTADPANDGPAAAPVDVVEELGAPELADAMPDGPIVTVQSLPEETPEPEPAAPAPQTAPEPAAPRQDPEPAQPPPEPEPEEPPPPTATERACASINAQRSGAGAAPVACRFSAPLADLAGTIWSLDGSMGSFSWHTLHISTIADIGVAVESLDRLGGAVAGLGPSGQWVTGSDYGVLELACVRGANQSTNGATQWGCVVTMK